ncbi:ankyrin repeat domain-containing protein [Cellulophaga sp. E16_2]|uniref:ankyrin repeat domain-containing protein n=1 Tax=Cellulophaga sp. E16_2 TaxID=2789297 RepID=UPI001A9285FD|nr:ankyrin repeat domain-containing protein [Cellulophaga sp. E16_2]MBO0592880.1 ankyrin repeat domain-containing protein [Cellulophaga sp. E16_2]
MNCELEVFELYLERGISVNYRTSSGNSVLLEAASSSHLENVNYFLSKGADVNVIDKYNYSPLRYASFYGDHEICKLLIDAGADIEFMDSEDYSILAASLKRADRQPQNAIVVKHLIEAGVDLTKTINGVTPLYRACKIGSYEIAKLFIDAGVDVNEPDENESVAIAAAANYPEIIKLLLSHGAHPSPFDKNVYNIMPLTMVAKCGNVASMKLLIEAGGDINDKKIDPIIFEAVKWGNAEMVAFLIEQGVDLSRCSEDGKTIQDQIRSSTGKEIEEMISRK